MDGKERLAEHLKKQGLTQTEFAAQVATDPAMVSQWLSGVRGPGLGYALEIERATAGAVPASSWVRARGSKKRHPRRLRRPAA